MSIIVTGMDMPKYCGSCDMSGTGVCRKWMCLTSYEMGKKRAEDCSLKSIDGLIDKINSKKIYKGRAYYSDMHDADMDKIHDIALDKAIKIIKEHCEVSG